MRTTNIDINLESKVIITIVIVALDITISKNIIILSATMNHLQQFIIPSTHTTL